MSSRDRAGTTGKEEHMSTSWGPPADAQREHAGAGPVRQRPGAGIGRRLVADGGPVAALRLLDSVTTTTGVLAATYQPTRTNGRHEHPGLD